MAFNSDPPPKYEHDDRFGMKIGRDWTQEAAEELWAMFEHLNISVAFSSRTKYLQGAKMVIIIDDSGSTNEQSDDTKSTTRFNEESNFTRDGIAMSSP